MAAALLLQLAGIGLDEYYRVSGLMNIDQKTGTGDWRTDFSPMRQGSPTRA